MGNTLVQWRAAIGLFQPRGRSTDPDEHVRTTRTSRQNKKKQQPDEKSQEESDQPDDEVFRTDQNDSSKKPSVRCHRPVLRGFMTACFLTVVLVMLLVRAGIEVNPGPQPPPPLHQSVKDKTTDVKTEVLYFSYLL